MNLLQLTPILVLAANLATAGLAAPGRPAEPARDTAAIVIEVAGRATAGQPPRDLARLSRLRAGDTVRTETGGSMKLAFGNGLRYRLGPGSSALLGSQGLERHEGEVEELPRVPALPRVPEVRDARGSRSAATRVRGEVLTGVYPQGTAVVADRARLLFDPLPNTPAYRVEIADATGERVYQTEVKSGPVTVPPGVLAPGARYSFKVETSGRPGPRAVGRGSLVTLADAVAREHQTLEEVLKREGDASAWTLLASVNRDLGLLLEAREASLAALALAPGDAGLLATLAEVEQQLRRS